MAEVLILRLDAPLMSFGAPTIDNLGRTARYPSRSMLTGLFANALGWQHGEWQRLEALQSRLRWAARLDRDGEALTEYQTVDLGQPHLLTEGKAAVSWTTRGRIEERAGGPDARLGTHQRWRDHWADAHYTVAVRLEGDAEQDGVGIEDLARAVQRPMRPLFLGRKPCLPAAPLFVRLTQTPSLLLALAEEPVDWQRAGAGLRGAPELARRAWWPAGEALPAGASVFEELSVTEERDWRNQIHVGERRICHGTLTVQGPDHAPI